MIFINIIELYNFRKNQDVAIIIAINNITDLANNCKTTHHHIITSLNKIVKRSFV